jgi:hypothetical protein
MEKQIVADLEARHAADAKLAAEETSVSSLVAEQKEQTNQLEE